MFINYAFVFFFILLHGFLCCKKNPLNNKVCFIIFLEWTFFCSLIFQCFFCCCCRCIDSAVHVFYWFLLNMIFYMHSPLHRTTKELYFFSLPMYKFILWMQVKSHKFSFIKMWAFVWFFSLILLSTFSVSYVWLFVLFCMHFMAVCCLFFSAILWC